MAAERPLVCPTCGTSFQPPGAEDLAFNGGGACPRCQGTGQIREVDRAALIPDEGLTIDQGAVAPWNSLMWSLMTDVCRAMGVRTDVPFRDLTPEEKAIVYDGPAEKKHILYRSKKGDDFAELDFTYYSAVRTVENALSKVKDEKGMKRVERFLKTGPCPDCAGTRLSEATRAPRIRATLDALCGALPFCGLGADWIADLPGETEADAEATRRLQADYPFTGAHVFPYSKRPGTPAAAFPGQVPSERIATRAAALRAVAAETRRLALRRFLGRELCVIPERTRTGRCEGWSAEYLRCRLPESAPRGVPTASVPTAILSDGTLG